MNSDRPQIGISRKIRIDSREIRKSKPVEPRQMPAISASDVKNSGSVRSQGRMPDPFPPVKCVLIWIPSCNHARQSSPIEAYRMVPEVFDPTANRVPRHQYRLVLAQRIVFIRRIKQRHVIWRILKTQTATVIAFEVMEFFSHAEHHFTHEMSHSLF